MKNNVKYKQFVYLPPNWRSKNDEYTQTLVAIKLRVK